ncbi:MAG: prepilin-type N-terminal cleavage/methylation domain-containing protein [Verrucomicrobia bacterium]|nr:prepilin-type N-terminal cleavage/methylation domain-containing protein [Verrucomicrobiota bacterium]
MKITTSRLSFSRVAARRRRCGFTLLEILLASFAAAMILVAIYGIFYRALKLRDNATQRTHEARLQARAAKVIRNDLRNALVSGGLLASTLMGSSTGSDGPSTGFPGYLKITATTGRDVPDQYYGDVQQVEYYIVRDNNSAGSLNAGTLVRAINRDLLSSVQQNATEEQILTGVRSLQVSFYDGSNWQPSWQYTSPTTGGSSSSGSSTSSSTSSGNSTAAQNLPEAIRIDIEQLPPAPPLEILVPWPTQPFAAATAAPSTPPSSATATPTPRPTPTPAAPATR